MYLQKKKLSPPWRHDDDDLLVVLAGLRFPFSAIYQDLRITQCRPKCIILTKKHPERIFEEVGKHTSLVTRKQRLLSPLWSVGLWFIMYSDVMHPVRLSTLRARSCGHNMWWEWSRKGSTSSNLEKYAYIPPGALSLHHLGLEKGIQQRLLYLRRSLVGAISNRSTVCPWFH